MRAVNWEENIDVCVWSRTGGRMGTVAVDSSEGALGRACGAAASSPDGGHCGLGLMAVTFGIKYGGADGGPRTGVDGRQKGLKEMPVAGALGAAEWGGPGFLFSEACFHGERWGTQGHRASLRPGFGKGPEGPVAVAGVNCPQPQRPPKVPPAHTLSPPPSMARWAAAVPRTRDRPGPAVPWAPAAEIPSPPVRKSSPTWATTAC